jgi:hypothetical protein
VQQHTYGDKFNYNIVLEVFGPEHMANHSTVVRGGGWIDRGGGWIDRGGGWIDRGGYAVRLKGGCGYPSS